jgi:hypothetical protein
MIAFLIGSKFPDHEWLRDSNRPRIGRAGASAPDLPEEQRGAALAELQAYEAELSAKPAEELRGLYDVERRRQAEEVRQQRRARAEAEERDRFFNRPSADADFVHWSRAAYWTIDEGVALILGKAPETVDWESVRDYVEVSPFVRQYANLRDLALRARESGQLALRTESRLFLDWAKGNDIDVPVELVRQVTAVCGARNAEVITSPPPSSQEASQGEKSLRTRERDTLLKLVVGMAVKRYGFDPQATRGTAIPEIVDDLASIGITLDPKTVRKWLTEAADLLPRELDEER